MGERQPITVALRDGNLETEATVFGNWAVHGVFEIGDRAPRNDQFTITHVPTGLCINNMTGWMSREHAEGLAALLSNVAPAATEAEAKEQRAVIQDAVWYAEDLHAASYSDDGEPVEEEAP